MFNLLRRIVGKQSFSKAKRNTYNLLDENAGALSPICDYSHWRVTAVRYIDLPLFFRALRSLVPNGSILCLAGGAWPDQVQNILDTISLNMESSESVNLGLDFAEAYYISIVEENMDKLVNLAEHSAEVEIAVHLAVLFENERILEWFDLPIGPIYIAETIKVQSAFHFAESVGGERQKIIFCKNRTYIDV